MSSVLTVQAGFVSPPIPVNQYSVVQVAPNASPGSVSVLYSQDSDTYIRAGTATWTTWPTGSVTSSSAMMSAARMFIQVSAQSSAATVSVSDPTPGQQEIIQSPWAGAEAGSMIFSSSVTFQGQLLAGNGSIGFPSYSFTNSVSSGISWNSAGSGINLSVNGSGALFSNAGQLRIPNGASINWSSGDPTTNAGELFLFKDAANILAQRNAITSQTFRVYGAFAAATSYASFSHNGTNAVMSTNAGGLALSGSTMGFFGTAVTTRPNVSSAVTTTAGTSVGPFGFVTAQQFQDTVNAVNSLQNAMKQLGLSA